MAKAWYRQGLIGGAATDLDEIAIADISDLDMAWVMAGNKAYLYQFDDAATDAEASPTYIRPDDYSTAGVWVLQQSPYDTGLGAMPTGLVMSSFVGGDASHGTDTLNDIDFAILSCMDSTNTVPISTAAVMTKRADAAYADGTTNGGMMNNGSYPFAAGKLYVWVAMGGGVAGDGEIGFLDVDDIANIAARVATAGHSYYKVFGFRHTLSGAAQWAKFTNESDYLLSTIASENIISTGVDSSLDTVDHSGFVASDYIDLIWYGVRDTSDTYKTMYSSEDGTNASVSLGETGNTPGDTDAAAFGASASSYIPYLSTREFASQSGTLDLLLHGVKFKR